MLGGLLTDELEVGVGVDAIGAVRTVGGVAVGAIDGRFFHGRAHGFMVDTVQRRGTGRQETGDKGQKAGEDSLGEKRASRGFEGKGNDRNWVD